MPTARDTGNRSALDLHQLSWRDEAPGVDLRHRESAEHARRHAKPRAEHVFGGVQIGEGVRLPLPCSRRENAERWTEFLSQERSEPWRWAGNKFPVVIIVTFVGHRVDRNSSSAEYSRFT